MTALTLMWTRVLAALVVTPVREFDRHRRDERGDVPGWVLITVMTAGLPAVR